MDPSESFQASWVFDGTQVSVPFGCQLPELFFRSHLVTLSMKCCQIRTTHLEDLGRTKGLAAFSCAPVASNCDLLRRIERAANIRIVYTLT